MSDIRPPPLKLLTTRPCAYETPALPVVVLEPAVAATHTGLRPTQEDRIGSLDVSCVAFPVASLYLMVDGHGGKGAAEAVLASLPLLLHTHMHKMPRGSSPADLEEACTRAFIDTERAYAESRSADAFSVADEGACVLAMIVLPEALVFANAGDCRALIVHTESPSVIATTEHRCDDAAERARIKKAGLVVFQGRVNGVLAVTRSIGDFELKACESAGDKAAGAEQIAGYQREYEDAVSCVPSTRTILRTKSQLLVLLMTDGVHDCVPCTTLTEVARAEPLQYIPVRVIESALVELSHDNASVLVFPLT